MPLSSLWDRIYHFPDGVEPLRLVEQVAPFALARKCQEIVNLSLKLSQRSATDWATQINPWEELVEGGRKLFGNRWAFCTLANTSAGIRSKDETCEDASELHDESIALCRRARYARLRAGASSWWESELTSTTDQMDLVFTLLVFWTWAGPTVLERLAALADEKLRTLNSDWWLKLSEAIQFTRFGFGQENEARFEAVVCYVLDGNPEIGFRRVRSSGNEELVGRCFELLQSNPPLDYSGMLIELIRANASAADTKERWLREIQLLTGGNRTRWITHGLYLGALANLTNAQLEALLNDTLDVANRLNVILRSGQTQCVEVGNSSSET